MASYAKSLQKEAKERARKVVARAARDGKLTGSEFDQFQRDGFWKGPAAGASSSFVANAIAREMRRNPDLVIGKGATKQTGVKVNKAGMLTHDPSKGQPEGFNAFGLYDDPGSAKWAQNSRGTYTYLGDRAAASPAVEDTEITSDPETDPIPQDIEPSQDLLDAREAWENDQVGGGSGGSIHFNPTGDGIMDAATYGNAATDDYFYRFVPSLNRHSVLEAREIGASGAHHLDRFIGKVPELGSAKDLYKYYEKKLG